MFYFEQMFDTALRGVMSAGLMTSVLTLAYGILLSSLLFGAYEAWTKGGDVRGLAIAGLKYLALAALFMNGGQVWESVFRAVVGVFNQVAHTMAGVGPRDVFSAWLDEIFRHGLSTTTLLNLITGLLPGLLSASLLLIAMVVYPFAYALFSILYTLYGIILFVCGPIVLALMPSFGLGSLAKRYAINVVIFASWGLIYAIFCRLTMAINIHSMAAIMNSGGFAGIMTGASQEVLLAVASILFAVCILLIPYLANRIVDGDLGGTMLTALGAATTLAQSLASAVVGSGGGASTAQSVGGGGGATSAGGAAAGGGSTGAASASSNQAPRGPSAGGYRPPNLPHAAGWALGAAAGMAVNAGQRAVSAVRRSGAAPASSPTPKKNDSEQFPVDEWI